MLNKTLEMIELFLNGQYDPLDFSYDFPEHLIKNYDELEREDKEINDILNDNMPEICAEYEIGFSPDKFKNSVKVEYNKIIERRNKA